MTLGMWLLSSRNVFIASVSACSLIAHIIFKTSLNPLNAELNPICHLLALLGGATIVVVSRTRSAKRCCRPVLPEVFGVLIHSRWTLNPERIKGNWEPNLVNEVGHSSPSSSPTPSPMNCRTDSAL